jgi:outer membrane protein assembly factor BamB
MSTLLAVIRRGFSIVLLGVLIAASASFAADHDYSWPQFHGSSRDNISDETGLLKKWPDDGPPLVWTVKGLGHGFSSLSIAASRIYTAGNIEKDTVITALDLNGNVLWRAVNGRAWTRDKYYPGARSTPTIEGHRVFHQSPLGNIVCLEAETGDIVWELDILNTVGSKNSRWALAESLLIDGDRVISCPGGPETCMVALDKNTGEIVWKAPSTDELAGYSSPLLFRHKGFRIITTLTAKAIIGVNADNGKLLWHVKHESYADENVMIPIFHDGHVFISTLATGSVKWKLNVEDGKASLEELWRTKEMDNHHGGVILLDGSLYGTSTVKNSKKWITLDWQTGQNKSMDEGVGKGSLTYADGMFYTLSIDRVMGLVRPSSNGLELVSSFEIPEGGKGKSWAHPVVCGGRLYIRHGDFLYAYNVR